MNAVFRHVLIILFINFFLYRNINWIHSGGDLGKEIRCFVCNDVFPSKVIKNLHTCNSILDKNISEEGQERIIQSRSNNLADHSYYQSNKNCSGFPEDSKLSVKKVKRKNVSGSLENLKIRLSLKTNEDGEVIYKVVNPKSNT